MKHTIRLSDTSHVSFPATSSLPPSVIEIILLPASPSSITLGAGIRAGVWGGDLSEKKKRKIPVFVTDCIHDGNAISVVVVVVVVAAAVVVVVAALPIDSLSLGCTVQYHNTT